MTRRFLVLFFCGIATALGVETAAPTPATSPAPEKSALKEKGLLPAASPGQTITTQIYSDEANFNTEKRIGIFTGHVRVFDPRFNIQSDRLTVYIHKQESEGLERAIAEGHVGVVREKPDPNGGPPSKSIGLSEKAVYTSSDGNVEMTGSPRVQEGLDTHIATTPQTVMIMNQDGHLTTHGPSRTEIQQQPSPSPGASATPAITPRPTPKVATPRIGPRP
jgi:lipopolysaccharide transport protein LptA